MLKETLSPSIGYINGGIGDIHHFSNSNKPLAFVGLDPLSISLVSFKLKRLVYANVVPRVLRFALVNAAWNVVRNNATFEAYYNIKRAEGRSHYNTLGYFAGELVKVIWNMLTDEVKFNLE